MEIHSLLNSYQYCIMKHLRPILVISLLSIHRLIHRYNLLIGIRVTVVTVVTVMLLLLLVLLLNMPCNRTENSAEECTLSTTVSGHLTSQRTDQTSSDCASNCTTILCAFWRALARVLALGGIWLLTTLRVIGLLSVRTLLLPVLWLTAILGLRLRLAVLSGISALRGLIAGVWASLLVVALLIVIGRVALLSSLIVVVSSRHF